MDRDSVAVAAIPAARNRVRLRRRLVLAVPALLAGAAARAQAYPTRPIRLVVPFAPGGIIDVVARILAEPLSRSLGQPVVIENLSGAGGSIGARAVARAVPDGHTLLLAGASQAVVRLLYPDAGLDPLRDFAPVALLGDQPFVLAVHPEVPAPDVPALLAWLRTQGDRAVFATTGVGAASHLAGELLKRLTGVDFTLVPYRGTPQAVTDLVAGRAQLMIDSQTLLGPVGQDGRVRLLAVTTPRRSRMLPGLPPLAEAGVPGFSASSWQALYAPAGTPAQVLAVLETAVGAALAEATLLRRFDDAGVEPLPGDATALARKLREEAAKWGPILEASGARPG